MGTPLNLSETQFCYLQNENFNAYLSGCCDMRSQEDRPGGAVCKLWAILCMSALVLQQEILLERRIARFGEEVELE